MLDELRRQEELLRKKNEPPPEPQPEADVHYKRIERQSNHMPNIVRFVFEGQRSSLVGEEWRCRFEDVKKEKERKEGRGDHRHKL